ncbi:hypothetical protein [Levilactobacillus wangkuiensis]|nr:hypothetical protein [Levilactobacillus wangkuiensis]
MGKFSKIAVTVMTVLLVGGAVPTTASAAYWHKGTPKVLRGHWKSKSFNYNGNKAHNGWIVGKKTITSASESMPVQVWKNLKYKKAGKGTYKFKGTCYQGVTKVSNPHIKMVKKNNHLKFKISWSSSYSYLGWYHK